MKRSLPRFPELLGGTTRSQTEVCATKQGFVRRMGSASMRRKLGGKEAQMATLKRIGPGSAFKVGLVTYAFLGLIIGACFAFFSMIARSIGGLAGSEAGVGARVLGMGFGLGAIIVMPIMYGIIGGIGGALGALIYNLVAGWIGGLEVDIS